MRRVCRITAKTDNCTVRVSIEMQSKRETLSRGEASALIADLADWSMKGIMNARYLYVPLSQQKVSS